MVNIFVIFQINKFSLILLLLLNYGGLEWVDKAVQEVGIFLLLASFICICLAWQRRPKPVTLTWPKNLSEIVVRVRLSEGIARDIEFCSLEG